MIISMSIFNSSFESLENEIPILQIENKSFYQNLIKELIKGQNGVENEVEIFHQGEVVKQGKELELILNPFEVELNKTKNLTLLYQFIKNEYANELHYEKTSTLLQYVVSYLEMLFEESEYQLEYEQELDLVALLKAMNVRFDYECSSVLNCLIDYVKVMHGFFHKKIFVFVQLKNTLSTEEMEQFYQFLFYEKIEVLLLESSESKERLLCEKYRIIDEDLCVIY